MSWDDPGVAGWWVSEVASDVSYARDVDPLLDLLMDGRHRLVADLGCGQGRLLTRFGPTVGIDRSLPLLAAAPAGAAVVCGDLTQLPLRDAAVSAACAVLVLEHLPELSAFFAEAARIVEPGGVLAVVVNHPVFTAPGSAPVVDSDGEVVWRWGDYFGSGWTDEPVGEGRVRFHHRSLGTLLGAAAAAGWSLECALEAPAGDPSDPLMAAQQAIPRLLGVRWRRP